MKLNIEERKAMLLALQGRREDLERMNRQWRGKVEHYKRELAVVERLLERACNEGF